MNRIYSGLSNFHEKNKIRDIRLISIIIKRMLSKILLGLGLFWGCNSSLYPKNLLNGPGNVVLNGEGNVANGACNVIDGYYNGINGHKNIVHGD